MIPVAVVGTGQSGCIGTPEELCPAELAREATGVALAQAGIAPAGIDAVVVGCGPEEVGGISNLDLYIAPAVWAVGKPVFSVSGGTASGAKALLSAIYQVASGTFGTVLALSSQKLALTGGDRAWEEQAMRLHFDCEIEDLCRQADLYLSGRSRTVTEEHAAMVAVKNRANSNKNDCLQGSEELSVEEVMTSPQLVFPMRELEVAALREGAVAVIVTSGANAAKLPVRPAWITGSGHCSIGRFSGVFDPAYPETLVRAAQRAYQEAWIYDPVREIDLAEVQELSSWQELIWMEALGICAPGEAGRMVEYGVTAIDGELPVNPSGGALSANPVCATGLMRQAEAASQIMRSAGTHQVEGVSRSVACSVSGLGREAVVTVFSGELP